MSTRVLVIEDEAPAARQLIALLHALRPQWEVIACLDSVTASVEYLQKEPPPQLIFMDIQLADGLSFSIFQNVQVASEVIFCTAFDQYAVEAFKRNAVHYLLKPIEPSDLKIAIERYETLKQNSPVGQWQALIQQMSGQKYKQRFLVKQGGSLVYLEAAQIAWFRSSGGLTEAWLDSGKRFILDHTLDELEQNLDPQNFFRISRQYMASLRCLSKISPHLNGRLKLELLPDSQEEVFVSRERVGDFKAWLGG